MTNLAKKKIPYFLLSFILLSWLAACSPKVKKAVTTPTVSTPDAMLAMELPLDKNVRYGKLDNGLTYYIRQNAKPENRAELRLAVNVGSNMETEKQLGLAHFVEHMAFNGTKNFEKNDMVNFFESVGTKFGPHLNAYTSFDETVYMTQLPTDKPEIMAKGFQVLEDWAHQLSFDGEEIDKERGVVIEEWRMRLGADQRMRDKYFPVLFKDSRYAERLPIGKVDVLENFEHQELIDFYKNWYRPDLMAVIAVGDFDVDEVEQKVKKHFSALKNPTDKKAIKEWAVPNHDETLVAIETDPEASFTRIQLMYKHDSKPLSTAGDYRNLIMRSLYNGMLNERLAELTKQAEPPFIFASTRYGGLVRTKDAYTSFAVVDEVGIEKGLTAVLAENKRVQQHGFVQTELERQKTILLSSIEAALKESDKTESRSYAQEYVSHYLDGATAPGIEKEYELYERFLPSISLEEINQLAKEFITDKNMVIVLTGPEKEGLQMPTKAEVLAIYQKAQATDVTPYTEKAIAESLMETTPKAAELLTETMIPELGITELTYANGIKIVLKPTDFKNDQILFQAHSYGGTSLYNDTDYHTAANFSSEVMGQSGIGAFSQSDLEKVLAGKKLGLSTNIDTYSEGMSGSCSPDDLEEFLQLVYLHFTAPRKDETAFEAYKAQNKSVLQNILVNPQYFFQNEMAKITADNHSRADVFPTPEKLDAINLDRLYEIYGERYADADDFAFFMVGNFDLAVIKPLLATYLGSLPSKPGSEQWKDIGIRGPKGATTHEIRKGKDPKSLVSLTFKSPISFNQQSRYYLYSMTDVLRIRLREVMREDKGGVYSVSVNASPRKIPEEQASVSIFFSCSPENVEPLIAAATEEIKRLQAEGTTEAYLQKVKETQTRTFETSLKENNFWMGNLKFYYSNNDDPKQILNYPNLVENLTLKDLQEAFNRHINFDQLLKVVLMPEE